jgi:hypothetical protein
MVNYHSTLLAQINTNSYSHKVTKARETAGKQPIIFLQYLEKQLKFIYSVNLEQKKQGRSIYPFVQNVFTPITHSLCTVCQTYNKRKRSCPCKHIRIAPCKLREVVQAQEIASCHHLSLLFVCMLIYCVYYSDYWDFSKD